MQAAHRVLFIGSKHLGLSVLRSMQRRASKHLLGALTIDDRSDRRSVHAEFVEFCAGCALPLTVVDDRRQAEQAIGLLKPDLCVVVGWYWLISERTLQSVPRGFVGIHNSRLPSYRGGAPLVWQMINGEPRAGFSIFQLTAGVDDGPLWAQGSVPIGPHDYVADVLAKLESKSLSAFDAVYPRILSGRARPRRQPTRGESHCAQRGPDDGCIDWSQPARRLYDFVRAQSEPYPGAYSFLGDDRLTIWRATVHEKPFHGSSGQIARITPTGVHVTCGQGSALTLLDVELDGRRGPATELIKSTKVRLGAPR